MSSNALYSMTGFARVQGQGEWGLMICELRSVNHRYLEVSIHLPDTLRELESTIRDQVRHQVKRGKIECYLRFQQGDTKSTEMNVNMRLARELCQVNDAIGALFKSSATTNTMDIVQWPGILQIKELDLEIIEDEMVKLLEKALSNLTDVRAREGAELKKLFFERLDAMKIELSKVKEHLPEILKFQREKLMLRFADAKIELDPSRLEQEMVLLAQRVDVAEEVDRLSTHISETQRILKQGGLAGRRLDFLMQELHREANTLGSKSIDVNTTRASVELKVLIEQMREQVQNIE
jgi:uncharacterized protein (TIGR00255 family)